MIPSHCARTFYKNVCALTCLPRGLEEVINPTAELRTALARYRNRLYVEIYLLHAFFEKCDSKSPILHAYPHQFGGVASDVSKLDAILHKPRK